MDEEADRSAELLARYRRVGDTEALDEAITLREAALGDPSDSDRLLAYGGALHLRAMRFRSRPDLARVVTVFETALDLAPTDVWLRIALANALIDRWLLNDDAADFDRAAALYRDTDSPQARSMLGWALVKRQMKGQGRDSEQALALCQHALAEIEDSDPDRHEYLSRFAEAAATHAAGTQDAALLTEARDAMTAVLDATKGMGPRRWNQLIVAIPILFARAFMVEDEAEIRAAEAFIESTLAELPADMPDRRVAQVVYGVLLSRRADDADIRDRAIELLLAGLPSVSPTSLGRAVTVLVTARLLLNREPPDVEQAITLLRDQLAVEPENADLRELFQAALSLRYERTADPADLATSVELGDSPFGRAAALLQAASGSDDELDAQIAAAEQALADLPDHESAAVVGPLAGALQSRFQRTGHPADLDRAIALVETMVDGSATDDPEMAAWSALLAQLEW